MNEKKKELVILVDEKDNETGTIEKLEAHKKALLHRAISVFICNSRGEWLLQRRAKNKYHSSLLWTNACCSHPYPGETSLEAAHRRLKEEMGLETSLTELFHFTYKAELDNGLNEHELDHVFLGITDNDPVINTEEVKDWKRISFNQLQNEIDKVPENYTVWFRMIFQRVNMHLKDYISTEKT